MATGWTEPRILFMDGMDEPKNPPSQETAEACPPSRLPVPRADISSADIRTQRGVASVSPFAPWHTAPTTRSGLPRREVRRVGQLTHPAQLIVAVAVGFEPTEGLPPHTLSRRAP